MSKRPVSGSATAFAKWKSAPLSWALFYLGHALNRLGWGVEKFGAWLMAKAVERLHRKAMERV